MTFQDGRRGSGVQKVDDMVPLPARPGVTRVPSPAPAPVLELSPRRRRWPAGEAGTGWRVAL